jgi:tetratricopeptide (TPR) repeat protein
MADNLGNYGRTLSTVKERCDEAEALYRRAIEADPKHANNLGNYAIFVCDVRKDLDRAQDLFRRAIEADPKHVNHLHNYAHFLKNIRKDLGNATELYKRAVDADPGNANNLGRYAGLLLALGRQVEGLSPLERAIAAPDASPAVRVECWFYALAHRPPEYRREAIAQLKRLLVAEGARSPRWDLSGNVERARSEGHADAMWLSVLAYVITERLAPTALDAWPAWTEA